MMAAVLALMLGAVAPAAGQQPPTPAQQEAALGQALAAHGMSAAGVGIVKAQLQSDAPKVDALLHHIQQANAAVVAAGHANPFNPTAFEAAMQAHKAAVLAAVSAQEGDKILMYQHLSTADKKVLALALTGGPAPAAH